MPNPISMIPSKPRVRRKRRAGTTSSSPVVGPVLVAASRAGYDLTLVFDRPVTIPAEMVPDEIGVFDGPEGVEYRNTVSVEQTGPNTVVVNVLEFAEYTGAGVTLDASAATGIVAAEGGEQWAGVSGVALPFS